jgi:DNA-binding LytR/AlgR family response regulator
MKLIDLASYEKQRIIRLPDHTTCLLHDIIFSEYFNHKIGLHLKGHKVIKVRASQAGMESLLCSNDFFVPCTKGIIVNLEYVKKIDDNTIFLEDDNQVPVSRRRMADIKKAHAAYLFQRVRQ